MLKKQMLVCGVALVAALVAFNGCAKKKVTTLQEPEPVKEVPVVEEPRPIDTSDNVSFNEAELEAEFKRKVQENLKTLYFDYDSYVLKQESIDKLAIAGAFLNEYPNVRVLIEGHCDERGSSEYNMGLGENRARAVKDYMTNYGISAIRIEVTSWGKERPVVYGCADDGCHSQNRRAEFKVLSH
jgi:peptidoglycan-associated lipoprotein